MGFFKNLYDRAKHTLGNVYSKGKSYLHRGSHFVKNATGKVNDMIGKVKSVASKIKSLPYIGHMAEELASTPVFKEVSSAFDKLEDINKKIENYADKVEDLTGH